MISTMLDVLQEHEGERTHIMLKSGMIFGGDMRVYRGYRPFIVLAAGPMTAVIPLESIEAFGFNATSMFGPLPDDEE